MFTAATDWSALGALSGIGSLLVVILSLLGRAVWRSLIAEMQQMNRQVTPPPPRNGSAPSTLGETVQQIADRQSNHAAHDDVRFRRVWDHLGIPEPEVFRQ